MRRPGHPPEAADRALAQASGAAAGPAAAAVRAGGTARGGRARGGHQHPPPVRGHGVDRPRRVRAARPGLHRGPRGRDPGHRRGHPRAAGIPRRRRRAGGQRRRALRVRLRRGAGFAPGLEGGRHHGAAADARRRALQRGRARRGEAGASHRRHRRRGAGTHPLALQRGARALAAGLGGLRRRPRGREPRRLPPAVGAGWRGARRGGERGMERPRYAAALPRRAPAAALRSGPAERLPGRLSVRRRPRPAGPGARARAPDRPARRQGHRACLGRPRGGGGSRGLPRSGRVGGGLFHGARGRAAQPVRGARRGGSRTGALRGPHSRAGRRLARRRQRRSRGRLSSSSGRGCR